MLEFFSSYFFYQLFSIHKESIVDIEGIVQKPAQKIQSCSQSDIEIVVSKVLFPKMASFSFTF